MITLVPMAQEDFPAFIDVAAAEYALEKIRKGSWTAQEAQAKSESLLLALLPFGLDTDDHFLFVIHDTARQCRVGTLWIALADEGPRRTAFVYDIRIDPDKRRQGCASGAFRALELVAAAHGASSIRLHVFGHNHEARALYDKLGFTPVSIEMSKPVGVQTIGK